MTKVFLSHDKKLLYFVLVLENLKLKPKYDGFLFLAESTRNPPKLNSHHHAELELNLVTSGSITYIARAKRFTFGKRSLVWMFPSQEHQLVDRSDDAKYYVAVFKPAMIKHSCRSPAYTALRRKGDKQDGLLHAILPPDAFDFICRTMSSLMQGSLDPDVLNREAGFGFESNFCFEHGDPDRLNAGLHHLLLECWHLQSRAMTSQRHVKLHPAVEKAVEILGADGVELHLHHLASRCGVSEAYLSRTFSQQIGVSLTRYRNSLRLSRFWTQYRSAGGSTFTEAVYAAGFGSYSQFYKIFSQAYGRGPRECLNESPS